MGISLSSAVSFPDWSEEGKDDEFDFGYIGAVSTDVPDADTPFGKTSVGGKFAVQIGIDQGDIRD